MADRQIVDAHHGHVVRHAHAGRGERLQHADGHRVGRHHKRVGQCVGGVLCEYALGERAAIAPLPLSEATVPNLFVKPSADARPAESKDGVVANLLEVGFRATDKEIME